MKSKRFKSMSIRSKHLILFGVIVFLLLGFIPHANAQFPGVFGMPFPAPIIALPPFPMPALRTAAFPLANLNPITVTVPQVTTAGLTITSLVPALAAPVTPTVSVILNLTAGTFLPTTFVAPFPLTAPVIPALPTVTATVALPPAVPTLTSIIALNLGGGIPGITGGGGVLTALPPPIPTTALPVVQIPTAATLTTIPVI
ncbi:MAG: hypothetical protein ACMUIP_15145 [bacterium]